MLVFCASPNYRSLSRFIGSTMLQCHHLYNSTYSHAVKCPVAGDHLETWYPLSFSGGGTLTYTVMIDPACITECWKPYSSQ